MKKYIKSSSEFQLYTIKNDYGYKLLSIVYIKGKGYEIWAEDGFKHPEVDQLSDDGYSIEFDSLSEKSVVDAWNKELSARDIPETITLDELKRKVRNTYF